jgi:serine/threonine-protein kinase RsbW
MLPNVRLTLSNRPENVLLVRETLTGVAQVLALDGSDLNDIRTAVTEACNNVVLHAYQGGEGPLEVEVYGGASGALDVVVRDRGTGIRPRIRSDRDPALGIGMSVIQALVRRVEFRDPTGGGTEVRMEFATSSVFELQTPSSGRVQPSELTADELPCTTRLTIAPVALAGTVLPRVLTVLAARAHFSTDRISDAQLLADALVAHVCESTHDRPLALSVKVQTRRLELRIGPLREGSAQLIIGSTVDGLGPVIERLTDDHRVSSVGSAAEMLALQLTDHT